jgi:hypothetical protein
MHEPEREEAVSLGDFLQTRRTRVGVTCRPSSRHTARQWGPRMHRSVRPDSRRAFRELTRSRISTLTEPATPSQSYVRVCHWRRKAPHLQPHDRAGGLSGSSSLVIPAGGHATGVQCCTASIVRARPLDNTNNRFRSICSHTSDNGSRHRGDECWRASINNLDRTR